MDHFKYNNLTLNKLTEINPEINYVGKYFFLSNARVAGTVNIFISKKHNDIYNDNNFQSTSLSSHSYYFKNLNNLSFFVEHKLNNQNLLIKDINDLINSPDINNPNFYINFCGLYDKYIKSLESNYTQVFFLNRIKTIDFNVNKIYYDEIHRFIMEPDAIPFYLNLTKKALMLQ